MYLYKFLKTTEYLWKLVDNVNRRESYNVKVIANNNPINVLCVKLKSISHWISNAFILMQILISPFISCAAIRGIAAVACNRENFITCVCMTRTYAVDFWQMEDGPDSSTCYQHVRIWGCESKFRLTAVSRVHRDTCVGLHIEQLLLQLILTISIRMVTH